MTDSPVQSTPVLVTSTSGLAVAHGPGVTLSHHSGPYPFLVDGSQFTKYHQQPSFLNHSGKRLMFYQHNFLFWLKPGVGRPRPGSEDSVDPQYQAPLTNILAVHAGKHGRCFTQSKQAQAVPDDRAWSLLVLRKDGKEEHVDLEASSRDERDKWVHALQSLIATAKRTEVERDGRTRWVDVGYRVDQQGQVVVSIAPAAASPAAESAAAAGPLTVLTAADQPKAPKTDDDTPSPPHSAAAAANNSHSAASDQLSTAGVLITDSQRSTATSTTGLDSSDDKLKAALAENERLKERIAELEEQLKGTRVDSVSAS